MANTDPDEKEEEASDDGKGKEGSTEIIAAASPTSLTSSTLLPTHIANVVSLVARSGSLYLRLGTFIGGLAIDGARATTLTGLELSRAVIEGILSKAGRDVSVRSTGELGKAEADSLLERSIGTLHSTITNISFAASTGFWFSSAALNSAGDMSQQLLATLDSILGSTDSSRAIASIITLIRREFQNPATGREGEKVGVADLLLGVCGLVLLQRWCKKSTDEEYRKGKCEEVVWDVVILDDGTRADVVGSSVSEKKMVRADSVSFMAADSGNVMQAIEREGRQPQEESDDDMPEINLRQKIMSSLPKDASVSITTETTTTKTIIVEITGAPPPDLSPPAGVEIIEEKAHYVGDTVSDNQMHNSDLPPTSSYRVVYRFTRNKLRGIDIESKGDDEEAIEEIDMNMEMKDDSPAQRVESPIYLVSPISSPEIESPLEPVTRPEPPAKDPPSQSRTSSPRSVNSGDERSMRFSAIPIPSIGNVATQKRSRNPMSSASSISGSDNPPPKKLTVPRSLSNKRKSEKPDRPPSVPKWSEKKGGGSFRKALRKGSSTTLSHLWNGKENSSPSESGAPTPTQTPVPKAGQVRQKPPWGGHTLSPPATGHTKPHLPVLQRDSSLLQARDVPIPRPPQRGNPNFFSSRDLGQLQAAEVQRSPSRTSYYSVHERRRDSLVSQTDTYSVHSAEARPGSPTAFRSHLKAQRSLLRARSEKNIVNQTPPASPLKNHRRSKSHAPSIYTLQTNNSGTSLVLASQPPHSAFQNSETLDRLTRTGFIDGMFPQHHIVRNITRFVRFASASYGSSFLRVMGIVTSDSPRSREIDTQHHHEHHSFSTHTQLPPSTILLSSFVDPQGGTDSTGQTNTGVPMVHFVSLDHESKAVVLTCRGTMGFEDVLTDMTCDYDDLLYKGKAYKVHKGMLASARRLLEGSGGRVMATIAASLEEFPDYGLVMTGHSLGGGVVSLLAILISEASGDAASTAFFTSSSNVQQGLLTSSADERSVAPSKIRIPSGRPVHVYAYGPPATLSPSLRLLTRGLITTIINGQDLVPYLSLGTLHDLQAVALAFKTDDSGAKSEVRKRVWRGLTGTFQQNWYQGMPPSVFEPGEDEDMWALGALKALRATMLSAKLLPPGEVFVVETQPVLQRDAFVQPSASSAGNDGAGAGKMGRGLGRPATRCVLKYVRDVEKRFGEVRFGGSALLDHSPGRYESSLGSLGKGVLG